MTAQFVAASHQSGHSCVLVNGASGVVGRAVLTGLNAETASHNGTNRSIDRLRPIQAQFDVADTLLPQVDAIVYVAPTPLLPNPDVVARRTTEILNLAHAFSCPIYYVGSALKVSERATPDSPHRPGARARVESQLVAEDLIRLSGIPHVTIRPSIVIGGSAPGTGARHPGIYHVLDFILRNRLTRIPLTPHHLLDLIPSTLVAAAIAKLIKHRVIEGEFWLTNGERALTLEDFRCAILEYASQAGLNIGELRFANSDGPDLWIFPGISKLQGRDRRKVSVLMDMFVHELAHPEPLETSLGDRFATAIGELGAIGVPPLPDQRTALIASLHSWGAATAVSSGIAALPLSKTAS